LPTSLPPLLLEAEPEDAGAPLEDDGVVFCAAGLEEHARANAASCATKTDRMPAG
jgi:hypothetical protein